jgi:hypothetical protein
MKALMKEEALYDIIHAACSGCGESILVNDFHPGDVVDLMSGQPYLLAELPIDEDDRRILVCTTCLDTCRVLLRKGHRYVDPVILKSACRRHLDARLATNTPEDLDDKLPDFYEQEVDERLRRGWLKGSPRAG